MKPLLTFFFNPFKLKLKHSLGAYDNKKKVPSPLGTILLILKRKRPFLYGKMGQNRAKLKIFLGPCDSSIHGEGIFRRPGS